MRAYQSVTDFLKDFSTRDACLSYLMEQKWANGYTCKKCGHDHSHKGRMWHHRKCAKCFYDESSTSRTLFHKIKFPIEKAFHMMWIISTHKKGISTMELARQFNVHQETAWFFKRKVQEAMKAKPYEMLTHCVEADEAVVGGREEGKPGRSLGKKKVIMVAIETNRDDRGERHIHRARAVQISGYKATDLDEGLHKIVEPDSLLLTDKWSGYSMGAADYVHWVLPSDKGKNFVKIHWHIFNLKTWIRGIHHKVSSEHMQRYLDEYHFRFNRRNSKGRGIRSLMKRMIEHDWLPYKLALGT